MLAVLLIVVLVVAFRTDLPEDEDLELLEDEVLLYYDEEDEGLLDEEEE